MILAAVSIGLILGILDASVVNVAVPALMRDLPASAGQVSRVPNVYSLMQRGGSRFPASRPGLTVESWLVS